MVYIGLRVDIDNDLNESVISYFSNDYKVIGFYEEKKETKQPHLHIIIHNVAKETLRQRLKRGIFKSIESTKYTLKDYTNLESGYSYIAKEGNLNFSFNYTDEEIQEVLKLGKLYKPKPETKRASSSFLSDLLKLYKPLKLDVQTYEQAERVYDHIDNFLNTNFSKQHNEYIRNQFFYGILQSRYNKLYSKVASSWTTKKKNNDLQFLKQKIIINNNSTKLIPDNINDIDTFLNE